MPDSAEITRAVQRGLMRSTDVAAFLAVSRQRVDQLVATGGFPGAAAGRRSPDVGSRQDRGVG